MKAKKSIIALVSAALLVLFSSCTTKITMYTATQPLDQYNTQARIVDAIEDVLRNNGYEIMNKNAAHGVVSTNWKSMRSAVENLALGVLTMSTDQFRVRDDKIMFSFEVTGDSYRVTPKTRYTSHSVSSYGFNAYGTEGEYPEPDSYAGSLTVKLMMEINRMLEEDNCIQWEKTVFVVED